MALRVSGGTTQSDSSGEPKPVLSTDTVVQIKDRYQVDSTKAMPDYDSPPAMAFQATNTRNPKRSLYALVCDPKLPPRIDVVSIMRRMDHPALLRVIDWDVVDWPQEGRRCPAVIMETPSGKRLFKDIQDHLPPMQEEKVQRYFVEPIIQILRELHAQGIYHRAIRPDNIFKVAGGDELIIGECVSAPCGMTNPIAYETLECTLASVAGRGEGGAQNDLYAVGVTMLALLTGHSPLADRDDETIQRLKLQLGSYAALVQNHRISLTMMEPLRGLLNDEPSERWTLEELSLWLNGRRLSPKQQAMPSKASRGLSIGRKDYFTAREVAFAMHREWDQAIALINSGALDQWLRRSLGEDDKVEAINLAKSAPDSVDKVVARCLIALDPDGPIRLKQFAATGDGVNTLIAAFADDSTARQLFADVLNMGLFHFWLENQKKVNPDHLRMMSRLEKVRAVMVQTGYGFGFERVVYELNASNPCLTQMMPRDYIATIEHALPALERFCLAGGEIPTILVDRHMAAFMATHVKRAIGTELRDIEREPDTLDGRMAQARLLSNLQEGLHRNLTFPALCTHLAGTLEPALDRFYSAERRERVRKQLMKAASSGRIEDLLNVVNDPVEVNEDMKGFAEATKEHLRASGETLQLLKDIQHKPVLAVEIGGQLAGAVAFLGCIATVAFSTFLIFI